jgi:hypothetical protein
VIGTPVIGQLFFLHGNGLNPQKLPIVAADMTRKSVRSPDVRDAPGSRFKCSFSEIRPPDTLCLVTFGIAKEAGMRTGQLVLISLLTVSASGCRYDGAFMQMDSNAPFPFFGLQLAVDSGVRPPQAGGAGHGDTARELRSEDIVPLRELDADESAGPAARREWQPGFGARRGMSAVLVRSHQSRFGWR